MRDQVAIFSYCRPKALSILKERREALLKRFLAVALFLLLVPVYASYLSAYLLYCVLWIPMTTSVIAGLKRVKGLSEEAEFRLASPGLYLLIPVLIVLAGSINNSHPQIKELSIEIPRRASSLRELKIVYGSDFHLGRNDYKVLDRFVAKVNAAHPDIILLGGDLLGGRGDPDLNKLKIQFRRFRAKYGAYAVLGNHDVRRIGQRFVPWIGRDFFAESGMKLLEDGVERIDNAFYLAGRNCERPRKRIEELLKDLSDDLPVILIDHYPPGLEKVRQSWVDLQLSGHTHNGQLFPLNLFSRLEYDLAYGSRVIDNTLFIVSSGVHYSNPPVNTQGYSEILHINAVFRSDMGAPKMCLPTAAKDAQISGLRQPVAESCADLVN